VHPKASWARYRHGSRTDGPPENMMPPTSNVWRSMKNMPVWQTTHHYMMTLVTLHHNDMTLLYE